MVFVVMKNDFGWKLGLKKKSRWMCLYLGLDISNRYEYFCFYGKVVVCYLLWEVMVLFLVIEISGLLLYFLMILYVII